MIEASPPSVSPKRRAKFLIGGGVLVVTVLVLVTWAMGQPGAASFYYTTTELNALTGAELPAGQEVRVAGKVVPDSIQQEGITTTFVISDGDSEVVVSTDQPVPDTLKDDSEVVARGVPENPRARTMRNLSTPLSFQASEVLAKCPSKFKAKAS